MTFKAITGAGGFVGSQLIKALSGHGEVRRLSRVRSGYDHFSRELESATTLFHLAAIAHTRGVSEAEIRRVNVDETETIARMAAKAGVRRLVFVSSIKAISDESDQPLDEESPRRPSDVYGRTKMEAEDSIRQVLTGTDTSYVIIRPPLVYGPEVKANFRALLKAVSTGMPLPLGSIRNRRSFVFVDNLVSAMIAADCDVADNHVFHVSDGSDFSTPELIHLLSENLECNAKLLSFPPTLLRIGLRVLGKAGAGSRLTRSLIVDSSKIKNVLSWVPPTSPREGIRRTCEWYRREGS